MIKVLKPRKGKDYIKISHQKKLILELAKNSLQIVFVLIRIAYSATRQLGDFDNFKKSQIEDLEVIFKLNFTIFFQKLNQDSSHLYCM